MKEITVWKIVALVTAMVAVANMLIGASIERYKIVKYLRDGPICSESTKRAADAIESGNMNMNSTQGGRQNGILSSTHRARD